MPARGRNDCSLLHMSIPRLPPCLLPLPQLSKLLTSHRQPQRPSPAPQYPQTPSPPHPAAARPASRTRAVHDIPSSRVGSRLRLGLARCISGSVVGCSPGLRSRGLSMLWGKKGVSLVLWEGWRELRDHQYIAPCHSNARPIRGSS